MTLLEKYERQVISARNRNIDWEFTYETWIDWWNKSGKLSQRGRSSSSYCMCRINDKGPYSPNNVYCATNADNNRDAIKNGANPNFRPIKPSFLGKHHTEESKKKISENSAIKLQNALIEERVKIYQSINMKERGSINRFAEAIGLTHTSARRFINKYILGV